MRPPRLAYIVTHPVTADSLLGGQLAFMCERGFDVSVIASPGPELTRVAAREGVRTIAVPMQRPIDLVRDPVSLVRLTAVLRLLSPDIVNASTPKAGLLGMLAARALRVPHRIYFLRGLRLETTTGTLRRVLATTERVACACADEVVCNSESLRAAAVGGGHAPATTRVIGNGSSNGVDPGRWQRTPDRLAEGRDIARQAGIGDDDEVIGFVGRFDRDKGIGDLLTAFEKVRSRRPRARLVLVGGGFAGDRDPTIARAIASASGVVAFDSTNDVAPFYARMDVLAFPSYREGFPNVPLEAACAEVPVVGYCSTGVIDAIADGVSGTIVPRGDINALASALVRYLADTTLRARHGTDGRSRAVQLFSRDVVWKSWETYYRELLTDAPHVSRV